MVQYIHAVTLVVPDYDAAIAFYVHQLGFRLAEDIALEEGKRWVRVCPPGAQQGGLILARAWFGPKSGCWQSDRRAGGLFSGYR